MNYGKALRIARAFAGLQQKDVARIAGIDPSYISLLEQGKRTPSLPMIENLSHALHVPLSLFQLLASEPKDMRARVSPELQLVTGSLTQLLLSHAPAKQRKRVNLSK
jgi:transcriptional regulator with XRE-family HTH domain